jgi:hypothetical protein
MLDLFPRVLDGTLREHYLLLFGMAGGIAMVAGIVGAWLGARFGSRRVVKEVLEALPSFDQQSLANQQLGRLSQAVDVMAIEIERLSEGQRFTAKLLAERGSNRHAQAAPNKVPGVITPH